MIKLKDILNEAKINSTDRIHFDKPDWKFIRGKKYTQEDSIKPDGLWYSFGNEWQKFAKSSKLGSKHAYHSVYKIDLQDSKILSISNESELKKFTKEYLSENRFYIKWANVAKKWDGIEFPKYLWRVGLPMKYLWYSTLDVASGCVWNTNSILNVTKVNTEK